jgi:DNA-binding NarL/FixJ family response regulator
VRAGAKAYVLKDAHRCRGQMFVSPEVATKLASRISEEELTNRELEILTFLAEGKSNKLIARKLNISEGTVKTHVKSILEKLDATSRTEAAAVAARRGLITL